MIPNSGDVDLDPCLLLPMHLNDSGHPAAQNGLLAAQEAEL